MAEMMLTYDMLKADYIIVLTDITKSKQRKTLEKMAQKLYYMRKNNLGRALSNITILLQGAYLD